MNGIQQVGFAHPVFAANANNPLRKVKRPVTVVFELKQRYVLKTKHFEGARYKEQDTSPMNQAAVKI